ncbi:MAG: hypothetical protein JWN98_1950 [Abditibacteriota bacterium]|nr:hypothetical protein [Abditibacteriota bacterium]
MKRTSRSLLLLGLLSLPLSWQLPSQADEGAYGATSPIEKIHLPYVAKTTDHIRRPVTINRREASTDDYLLEMARSGDINVLADVTDVDTEVRPLPVSGSFPLAKFNFLNLIRDRNLTSARISENSFLYWPSPDIKQLVQSILAHKAANPRPTLPALDEEQTIALFTDYFKRAHDWDGKWANVDIKVPLAALPPELRTRVETEFYEREVSGSAYGAQNGAQSSGALLNPQSEFWKKAHLSLGAGSRVPRGTSLPALFMNRFSRNGSLYSGQLIGHLLFLEKKTEAP